MSYLVENSLHDLAAAASSEHTTIAMIALKAQLRSTGEKEAEVYQKMTDRLQVMRSAVEEGCRQEGLSDSGLSGGDAVRYGKRIFAHESLCGPLQSKVIRYALAVAEQNAKMGRIVAAPTAGSSGVLPAVLLAAAEEKGFSDEKLIEALFTAAAVGQVIAFRASLSGAAGGCQAECGSASGMAAAALVEMAGGSPEQSIHACALAVKSMLGLVCDPVAGLVEVPCVKRNAFSAVAALTAADMALADIRSFIPPDEVLDAMKSVGQLMHPDLKETAAGGLAATPAGKKAAGKCFSSEEKR